MKKLLFLFVFIIISRFVYSQSEIIKFLSLGFNTKDECISTMDDSSITTYFYFYGYKDYSEAIFDNELITLSIGESGAFYPDLYIRHKFSNKAWTDFFNNYLKGYNGKFTNDEIMKMFSDNEKKLLDLIIKYENRR